MDKPWKIALVLLGIFLAGALTGGAVAVRIGRSMAMKRAMPEQWGPMQLKRLAERLDLSAEQLEQLRPIVRRNMEELNRLRTYAMGETRTILERMQRDIADKLTPEQRVKFEQMGREMRERAQRMQQERGQRPFGPGDRRERPPGDRMPKVPGDKPPEPSADKPPGH